VFFLPLTLAGFVAGFAIFIGRVVRPVREAVLGLLLGVAVPASLILFAEVTKGPVMNAKSLALAPIFVVALVAVFVGSGVAFGWSGSAAVKLVDRSFGRSFAVLATIGICGLAGFATLAPIARSYNVDVQWAAWQEERARTIAKADFTGEFSGYQVTFPASPRLLLWDDCGPAETPRYGGCSTFLSDPVTILTRRDEILLHERADTINFLAIRVDAVEPDCGGNDYCITQERIDRWCTEVRPDQADTIWCDGIPPMDIQLHTSQFGEKLDIKSDREEPDLAALYADTPLGAGRVFCRQNANTDHAVQRPSDCRLTFTVADGVEASLSVSRNQMIAGEPIISDTISLIPEYWLAITEEP